MPSYNFKGLRGFKSKLQPDWRPRYLAVAGGSQPRAGAARRHAADRPRAEGDRCMRLTLLAACRGAAPPATAARRRRLRHRPDPEPGDPAARRAGDAAVILFSSEAGWSAADAATARAAAGGRRGGRRHRPAGLPRGARCRGQGLRLSRRRLRAARATRSSARPAPSTFHAPLVAGSGEGRGARARHPGADPRRHARRRDRRRSGRGAAAQDRALHLGAARSRRPDGSSYGLPGGRAAGAADRWC